MKILHIYTEEPSAKIVFDNLLPRILPPDVPYRIYPHQGKQDLEKGLRKTLPSISKIPGSVILVTRDQDNTDCVVLKKSLSEIVEPSCTCPFFIRILCYELESWFLGDLSAIEKAYPRFRASRFEGKAELRDVDKVVSPNRYLLQNIPEYSGRDYLPKLETAENISKYMDIEKNFSESFRHTLSAIQRLVVG